ncbi:hypothetical protein REPUB_Repub15cG0022600 [Reevesia pubescens]
MFYFLCKTILHGRHTVTASQSHKLFCIFQNDPSSVLGVSVSLTLRCISSSSYEQSFTVSYLKNTCGLSSESALTASKFVHFGTPEKPDSVIAFFKNQGLSERQIASLIRARPRVLLSDVKKTLLPKLEFFKSKGVSIPELCKILGNHPIAFFGSLENHIIPSFNFLSNLLKSDEAAIKVITCYPRIMTYDLDNYMLPDIDILRNYGVPESNIVKVLHSISKVFLKSSVQFKETVEKVKEMGFSPSRMTFVIAVLVLNFMAKPAWDKKFDVYKKCGWSDKEIMDAFRKYPTFISVSEDKVVKIMDFLVKEMGLQPSLIAKRPRVITQSLEKRIVPRGLFARDLLSKGLVKKKFTLYALFESSEKLFIEKFVTCYKADAPELLKLYQQKLDLSNNWKAGTSRLQRL